MTSYGDKLAAEKNHREERRREGRKEGRQLLQFTSRVLHREERIEEKVCRVLTLALAVCRLFSVPYLQFYSKH